MARYFLPNCLTKLEIETKTGFADLKAEISNINATLGIKKEQIVASNQRVDKLEVELKEQKAEIKEIRVEQKNFIENIMKNFAEKFFNKEILQEANLPKVVY